MSAAATPDEVAIGSLFSGIGGLELGVEAALHEAGWAPRVLWQVELDDFCRAVLAKHWPGADRTVTDVCADAALSLPRVDLLVGGPPCQDISGAGKQEGLYGERSGLLFRYLQIVGALRPRMAIAENVRSGSWKSWLGVASCGLRALGYRVEALEIHAADVGAPHRRARIFVVAYADGGGRESLGSGGVFDSEREALGYHVDRCDGEAVGNASRARLAFGQGERCDPQPEQPPAERAGDREAVGDPGGARRPGAGRSRLRGEGQQDGPPDASGGLGQAQPLMGRSPDGLPARVDLSRRWPSGQGEAPYAWEPPRTVETRSMTRRPRLRALGNAVVPAVAREAMRWALAGGVR